MNHRERVKAIIAGEPADRCGFWLGNPHADTWPILKRHLDVATEEDVRQRLHDDLRWISPEWSAYRAPDGKGPWEALAGDKCHGLASAGALADVEDPAVLADLPWPEVERLDFTQALEDLKSAGDAYRASGFWCPFFHIVSDLFGMENYFIKMFTHPDVVHAATRRVCEFYLEANERFFDAAGDLVDASFFGNDFGTQLDLLVGPEQFDTFIMPWFRKFTAQGHTRGYQVILHSCGAIHRVIDRLIEAGVDCLHPLQAQAADMDADSLARDFKGRIAFMGGIDTQDLLVNVTPAQVAADVARVMERLGPQLIVSPSHEAVLPNVPPENIAAMSQAVTGSQL